MIPESELQGLANPLTHQGVRRLASLWFKHHSRLTTFFSPSRWHNKGVPQGILDLQEFVKTLPDDHQALTPAQIGTFYMLDVMRTYRSSSSTQNASSNSSRIYSVVRNAVKDYPSRFNTLRQQTQQESEAGMPSWRLRRVSTTWEEVRKKKGFLGWHKGTRVDLVDLRITWGPTTISWVKAQNEAIQEAFVTAFEEAQHRRVEDQFFSKLCVTEGNCAERVDAAIRWAARLWKDTSLPLVHASESLIV